jgi:hypothetical protein
MEDIMGQPRKRVFIALLCLSLFCMAVLSYAVWEITYLGLMEISQYLPLVLGFVFAGAFLLVSLGIISMVAAIWGLPPLHIFQRQTYAVINFLFPIAVMLGKAFGYNRRYIERSFIAVSNQIIHQRHLRVPADRLLVVTPHCLQLATCPHKITRDPKNCQRCGACNIGALVDLSEKIGFHFFVVTGGTLARQTVKSIRPQAVLAIACERDLTSGIQDVYPLPAVGVLNIRPNGPCFNTKVDMELVEKEIRSFLIEKDD